MSNQLVAVQTSTIGNESVQTVNARELHEFLGVGKDYSTWMQDRIAKYEFIENQDFGIFPSFGEKGGRGRPAKEYFITLDMAKELSMVERNEKGKQARQYFIRCEKELKAAAPKLPQTYLEALEAHLQSEKDKLAMAAQLEQQRPKVEFAERLVDTDNTWTRRHAAKMIKVPQQKFNAWLKDIGHNENNRNAVPTQYAIDRGYQTVVVGEANGISYAGPQITMKGLLYYANKWYKKAVPGDVIKNIERAEDEVQESLRLK